MSDTTAADREWMGKVAAHGCVACRKRFGVHEPTTVHHITSGGRRMGHLFTIPLCPWHHMGLVRPQMTTSRMTATYGPSFAKDKGEFERVFGTELDLLEEVRRELGSKSES